MADEARPPHPFGAVEAALPKHLRDYLTVLRTDQNFKDLLATLPIPAAAMEWTANFDVQRLAYKRGLRDGVQSVLLVLGRKPDTPSAKPEES